MDVNEIFAKVKAHMLEGMVFHDEMVRYYGFLNCDDMRREHECRYEDETKGYRKLGDYYMNHYNMLIPIEPMERPDIIPESWYRYMRQDVDTGTRNNAKEIGARKWVEWERQTKKLYEDMWKELVDIKEIASAKFLSHYISAVDDELTCAEKIHMSLNT